MSMMSNIGVISSAQQGPSLILDEIPGAVYAGALRKLRSAYYGPVVELHQYASANTDDFYVNNIEGELRNSSGQTPTEWLISNGFPADEGLRIRTLYNQAESPSFPSLIQNFQSLQPHIWKNGEPDYYRIGSNNRITMRWDPNDDALECPGTWPGHANVSVFIVEELLDTEPAHLLIQGINSSNYRIVSEFTSSSSNVAGTSYKNGVATGASSRKELYEVIQGQYSGGREEGPIAAQYIDFSMPNPNYASWYLNKYSSFGYFSNECRIGEIIMYPSDMTAEIATINDEQSAYYGTPDVPPWSDRYSFQFNGIDQFFSAPQDPIMDIENNLTISVWVKPVVQDPTIGDGWVLDKYTTDHGYGISQDDFGTGATGGRWSFILGWDDGTPGGQGVERIRTDSANHCIAGVWQHVVGTYDSVTGDGKIYMNGVLVTTSNLGAGTILGTNTSNFHIGCATPTGTTPFYGSIDEASVWDITMSQAQVTELYNGGAPANLAEHSAVANGVLWYRMGDGSYWGLPGQWTNRNQFNVGSNNALSDGMAQGDRTSDVP